MFSPVYGERRLTVKTADFCRFPIEEMRDDLCIVCGDFIGKSSNSIGLERDFFRQKQAFYKCDPKWGEIQNDYRNQEEKQADRSLFLGQAKQSQGDDDRR